MRSQKEIALNGKITGMLNALLSPGAPAGQAAPAGQNAALAISKLLLHDEEVQALQEYANTVSIKRLGYNDHGPVHMRTVALNALIMMGLLRDAGIKTSLEKEECGSFEDSIIAILLAATLHDVGMSVGRPDHELHSSCLACPILDRLLAKVFPKAVEKRVVIRSLALEGISGHMGNRVIHSLEAGVILVADGCDMQKGRARIPMALSEHPRVGDIHKYSANSIEELRIEKGAEKPVRIGVSMSSEVGLFQIEEVLLQKIAASTAKAYIELYAQVNEGEPKRYL
ncbi:MAG: phosphohydrolase [Treponema sp.]|jgi:metal-dependent HD superfamily phosphatase/phosphodiesterase|nr:phosphohydrolase [Treponema sp.]